MKNNAARSPFGGKVAYRTFTLVLLFLFLCTTIFIQTPLDVQALEPAGQLVTLSSLPEGVYAIRTMDSTDGGKYMTVLGSDPTLGGRAVCQSDESDPCANQTRSELFKISKVEGTTDCYIIRSMLNNCLALRATYGRAEGDIVLAEVSPDDNEVYADRDNNLAVWKITQTVTLGYTLSLVKSNLTEPLYIQKYSIDDSNAYGLKLVSDYTLLDYSWCLYQYTGALISGTGTYSQRTDIAIGERLHLGIYWYDSRIGCNEITYWMYGDGLMSKTSRFAVIDNRGNLTATSYGTIVVYYQRPDNGSYIMGPTITIRPFPDNATNVAYNFRNGDTNLSNAMYFQPESTSGNLTACYTKTGTSGHYEWRLIAQADGYYQIYNRDISKYLESPEDVSSGSCFILNTQSLPTSDKQLWAIIRQPDGRYLIQSKNAKGTEYYLAMAEGNDGMSWMYPRTKSSAGDRAYWYIEMDSRTYYYDIDLNPNVTMPNVGDALEYDPSPWEGMIQYYTNCYSYAMNCTTPYTHCMQPGMFSGSSTNLADCSNNGLAVMEKAIRDSVARPFSLRPIGKYDELEEGEYRVCLVVDNYEDPLKYYYDLPDGSRVYEDRLDVDYHWYRQNADGTWSHKPGTYPVTNVDTSGNVIYDPEFSNRNHYNGLYYNVFVCWFAAKPISNTQT